MIKTNISDYLGVQAEVRDIGVFADAPPSWLREEKEKDASKDSNSVTDKLNWEAFLDVLGMKPLSPCSFHRKVAGTILPLGRKDKLCYAVLTVGSTQFQNFPIFLCRHFSTTAFS